MIPVNLIYTVEFFVLHIVLKLMFHVPLLNGNAGIPALVDKASVLPQIFDYLYPVAFSHQAIPSLG